MKKAILLGEIFSENFSENLYIRYKISLEYVPVIVGEGKEN